MTQPARSSRSKQPRGTSSGAGAGRHAKPDIDARLQRISEALRQSGLSNPVDCLEQVAQLIFLKRIDEREPTEGSKIFPGLAARRRWSRLRNKREGELQRALAHEVLPYMASLDREAPAIADYYHDATLKIEDPAAVHTIFDAIDGIDFSKLEPDEMGTLLERLLTRTSPSTEFRTPRHVRALMVALVAPGGNEALYDPACGTGGMLTDAASYILANHSSAPREVPVYGADWLKSMGLSLKAARERFPLQTIRMPGGKLRLQRDEVGKLVHGHDISRRMVRIARMMLELHGLGAARVRRANTLSSFGGLLAEEIARRFDVILCAPPFGDAPSRESIRTDLPVASTRQEILFLEIAMTALAPGGHAAILVPDTLLFSEGLTHIQVRRHLVEAYEVLAVISLPPSTLSPHSAVETSIVVFRRPTDPTSTTDHVWFYKIERDGYDRERKPAPEENDIPDLLASWERYKASGFKRPLGPESATGVDLEPGLRCWWARRKTIEENLYDLSAKRYEPRSEARRLVPESPASLEEALKSLFDPVARLRAFVEGGATPFGRAKRTTKRLDELVTVEQGRTPPTGEPAYWNGSIPWVSPKDMKDQVIYDTQDHVTQRAIDDCRLTVIPPPSVLVVVRSMILSHRIPVAITNVPVVVSQDIRALCPLPGSGIDAWYLLAYLNAAEDMLLTLTLGTAHGSRSLPRRSMLDLEIPLPAPEVRERIGGLMRAYVAFAEAGQRARRGGGELFQETLRRAFGARQKPIRGGERSVKGD